MSDVAFGFDPRAGDLTRFDHRAAYGERWLRFAVLRDPMPVVRPYGPVEPPAVSVRFDLVTLEAHRCRSPRPGCPPWDFWVYARDQAELEYALSLLRDVDLAVALLHLVCAIAEPPRKKHVPYDYW